MRRHDRVSPVQGSPQVVEMKEKHLRIRIEQCLTLSKASNCPRAKFGALLVDPDRNVILMDGYNGGPRGGGELCVALHELHCFFCSPYLLLLKPELVSYLLT